MLTAVTSDVPAHLLDLENMKRPGDLAGRQACPDHTREAVDQAAGRRFSTSVVRPVALLARKK